jgi:hypothetical protein
VYPARAFAPGGSMPEGWELSAVPVP